MFVSDILWDNSRIDYRAPWHCLDWFSESEIQHRGAFHERLVFGCDCSPPFPLDCSGNRWLCLIPPTGKQISTFSLSNTRDQCDTLRPFASKLYSTVGNTKMTILYIPYEMCILLDYTWLRWTSAIIVDKPVRLLWKVKIGFPWLQASLWQISRLFNALCEWLPGLQGIV